MFIQLSYCLARELQQLLSARKPMKGQVTLRSLQLKLPRRTRRYHPKFFLMTKFKSLMKVSCLSVLSARANKQTKKQKQKKLTNKKLTVFFECLLLSLWFDDYDGIRRPSQVIQNSQVMWTLTILYIYFAELQKLKGSKVVVSSIKTTIRCKGKIVEWPYHIKCGVCGVERQIEFDRAHAGIIKKFRTGMGISFMSYFSMMGKGTSIKLSLMILLYLKLF